MDGGAFAATTESGSPSINASSNFVGGSLESSNVDVSEEFSKLIVTQQAYSANTKIISTANSMMQDTINIIR
jgi:flagellar hook protein FlgE